MESDENTDTAFDLIVKANAGNAGKTASQPFPTSASMFHSATCLRIINSSNQIGKLLSQA